MNVLEVGLVFFLMVIASYTGTMLALHYYFEDAGPDSSSIITLDDGRDD